MLVVSSAWHDQFNKPIVNEALIKFIIEDYGTLYGTDIFSYTFKGSASPISNKYPTYEARLELVMRNDYLNFSTFIGKSVEIYYGFKISGSEQYAKAQTLFIDSIEISDSGRIAYFNLKSIFAYLTKTISVQLYSIDNGGTITYTNTFRTFLSSQLTGISYSESGTNNSKVRNFPSKITLGQALQELCFVNMRSLSLDKDGQIIIKDTDYGNVHYFNGLNITTYPHIEKMDMPSDVVIDMLDLSASTNSISNIARQTMEISYHAPVYRGNFTIYCDNDGAFITKDTIAYATQPSGTITESFDIYNDHIVASANGSGATDFDYEIGGFAYNNYANTENGKTTIFNVNIVSLIHRVYLDTHITQYLRPQQTCEIQCRFDPSFELLDNITTNNGMKITIEELNITYKGSYKARIKGRYDTYFADPIVQSVYTSTQADEWYADIYNPNPDQMSLKISSSQGVDTLLINGHETLRINNENCPSLDASMYASENGNLDTDVYCWFVNSSSQTSGNSFILVADW